MRVNLGFVNIESSSKISRSLSARLASHRSRLTRERGSRGVESRISLVSVVQNVEGAASCLDLLHFELRRQRNLTYSTHEIGET